jgi:hypothetical protein
MKSSTGAIKWDLSRLTGFGLKKTKKNKRELQDAINNTGMFSNELIHRFDKFTRNELGYETVYFKAIAINRFAKYSILN